MPSIDKLRVKIFADGADLPGIRAMAAKPYVRGFTTNPTLMRRAGVASYRAFAKDAIAAASGRPISFEVLADDFAEMERQAREIATWHQTVNVKIPVTDTAGRPSTPLIERLSASGIAVNVTAVMTLDQVREVVGVLNPAAPAIVSIFAGRIADTGRDPVPHMSQAVAIASAKPKVEVLWASPRELLNVFQADACGCHIITATNDLLIKLETTVGKDLLAYSRETVEMFYRDAVAANYTL